MPACIVQPDAVELHRFYVDRPWHGRAVAQALMAAARDAACALGAHDLWLGVWERNARAIAFYRKCGFVDVGSHHFFVGEDRQTDRVLVARLADD
jgi:GNAT superfamily N-acetyltransferase